MISRDVPPFKMLLDDFQRWAPFLFTMMSWRYSVVGRLMKCYLRIFKGGPPSSLNYELMIFKLMPGSCSGKNIILILTDYIQKRRAQALLFSFEYNLLPNLTWNFNYYLDRALIWLSFLLISPPSTEAEGWAPFWGQLLWFPRYLLSCTLRDIFVSKWHL